MSTVIINNTTLQDAMSDWAKNTLHVTRYPDFIAMCEFNMNRRFKKGLRQMEASASLTTTTVGDFSVASLPTDYLTWRAVIWPGTSPDVELDWVDPPYLRKTWVSLDNGQPKIFTIENGTVKILPISNGSQYEFLYYQKIPALTTPTSSNWLILEYPDAYLFGSLAELFKKARDMENAVAYTQMFKAVLDDIEGVSDATQGETSPMVREASYY